MTKDLNTLNTRNSQGKMGENTKSKVWVYLAWFIIGIFILGGIAFATVTISDTSSDYGNTKISNVADPTSAQDVATKNYVDANSGTITAIKQTNYTSASSSTNPSYLKTFTFNLPDTNSYITGIIVDGIWSGNTAVKTAVKIQGTNFGTYWLVPALTPFISAQSSNPSTAPQTAILSSTETYNLLMGATGAVCVTNCRVIYTFDNSFAYSHPITGDTQYNISLGAGSYTSGTNTLVNASVTLIYSKLNMTTYTLS